MGHYSSVLQWVVYSVMYKLLIASCLAVATLSSPEADADAHVPAWPSIRGYGVESTCYGCRPYPIIPIVHTIGKRSAEAEPYYGYGYLRPVGHSTYGVSQFHPSGHSFQHVTRLHKGEAEAQPEADPYYGYGHGLGYGHRLGYGYRLGYTHGGYYGHGYGHGYGSATMDKMEALNSACAIVISTLE